MRVYYKDAVAAFIVFDVTKASTFAAVQKWKEDIDRKVRPAVLSLSWRGEENGREMIRRPLQPTHTYRTLRANSGCPGDPTTVLGTS